MKTGKKKMRKKEQLHLAQCDRLKIVFVCIISIVLSLLNKFQIDFKQVSNRFQTIYITNTVLKLFQIIKFAFSLTTANFLFQFFFCLLFFFLSFFCFFFVF